MSNVINLEVDAYEGEKKLVDANGVGYSPFSCPYCTSDSVSVDKREHLEPEYSEYLSCGNCLEKWVATYQFYCYQKQ
tara:strand:- start:735 stop:965 length:231 start_codon:yes stop_codon:yes gene_type:complete